MFTDLDRRSLASRGISEEEAARQLHLLRNAPPSMVLERACTIGDGIEPLPSSRHDELLNAAEQVASAGRVTKFVPASGAATRMFKDLIAALGDERPSETEPGRVFFDRIDDFPFAAELRQRANLARRPSSPDEERRLLRTLLEDMQFAELPKALIPFHRSTQGIRTPFEEHLLEGTQYTRARDGIARTHFTVAPEFRDRFDSLLAETAPRIEQRVPGTRLEVSFSEQHPSTDTLAITPDGQPFRTDDGALLFRPAGHGALLRNLHSLNADIVVIKNIDNILPFEAADEAIAWKRLLIGFLAGMQQRADDRPLRVCGVVRNEGEPGGAPFWVVDREGRRSMQIVESSQVNLNDPGQRRIFESSTHFNPVDIVCALKRRDGHTYDLSAFVDPAAVFLARKSYEGRELIALERPGLWNGAMAQWRTVFVEVPASTFAPVKTVFDLLRPQHQSL